MNLYKNHNLSRIHTDWSVLVGQSFKLADRGFRKEVLDYSRQIMAEARCAIESVIEQLVRDGYRFVDPAAIERPASDVIDWIEELETLRVYVPISLQAWLIEVGSVNLMGSHLAWQKPAYVFENMRPTNDVWYTDPLVVQCSREYLLSSYEDWLTRTQEEGPNEVGPFQIEISPDHIHKANVSGGAPYMVEGSVPLVDSLVYNERKCASFTEHVRNSLKWGGFPGFEYIDTSLLELATRKQVSLI